MSIPANASSAPKRGSVLVIYSGGMDSLTLLHWCLARYERVDAVSFDYGQRHSRELDYAEHECSRISVSHTVFDLTNLRPLVSSALTSNIDVPEGHYAAETMKATVVPGRNTIMLSIAMGIAESRSISTVAYGAHAGDHHIYPDCRPEYFDALQVVFERATEGRVRLLAPFLYYSKGHIVRIGRQLCVDYARSWTCYVGDRQPCGQCGACVERAEAFAENGIADPLLVPDSPDRAS